ncbi:hypothetical protein Goshw_028941 [Gossypium schwendimanii]|uniref:DUF4283 domain-containing protein n=1 Tax=Gossypium schwendimanii TaxID=34291 RepID=A0A7J9KPH4_GOSSC|nr:hypothetical protein [Gossypium schwendimanii]
MEDSIANLKIHDGKEEVWAVEEDMKEVNQDYCLVDCFLTAQMVNFQVVKNTLAKVWNPTRAVVISDLEENRFLLKFYHEVDVERVIKGAHELLITIYWFFTGAGGCEGSFKRKEKIDDTK